jgi:tetratricopeptide (TPR) repeat protein
MSRFHVLIHAPLYATLRRLPPDTRGRFRRRVARLSAGEWSGGTRVKKLRGCAKPVFEARQDDGDRLLFTLAHTAARDATDTLPPHLQIWDLVHHDRVSGRAGRINPSAEAEFLDWEELEAELIDEPPPHPAASFADVPPPGAGVEAGVVELMLPPDSLRLRAGEELVGGVRWYVLPERLVVDEALWQELADRGGDELELKLTAEQYAVVRSPGPVLLSGSAGSGKTTIAVHRVAAAAPLAHARVLYVTYSRWLLDHARRLFADLRACRGDVVVDPAPDFLTVHDLYRAIIARTGASAPEHVVDYPEFERWYRGAFRRDDSALAWEEIRSIVKGASLDPARPLLARDDYEALGRKRAPLFVNERPRLYQVARRWQEYLDAGRRVDEIDLCRLALARVPPGGLYDHLLCDEAQDLAEMQVELLLRLSRGPSLGGLLLAGDPQQVINPSGFRWAEVRSRIRDRFRGSARPTPDLHVLTRNFRSVRGIVDLANEILAFKRDRVGRSDGDQPEESVVSGPVPIWVTGGEAELVEAIRGFGPRCAVVTGSADVRARLQAALDTTRIFTVPEAKGLEFDAAVLWGVVAADPAPWIRLLDPALDLREDPAARRALHHLYVAATRARRHLAVYEPGDAAGLWRAERFAARLDPEAPASLSRLFVRSATPGEWMREAEYFLERGRHRQAAECFRRAGDLRREAESLAWYHEAAGEPRRAAEQWLALGETRRAAACLEQAGDFAEAAREWEHVGDALAARRCRARAAEAARSWNGAASAWEELQAWSDAARCWANAGARPRQIRCLALAAEDDGRPAAAAERWVELEDWARAATAWRAAGDEGQAQMAEARGHEGAGRWDDAAGVWQRLGDATRALRCRAVAAERTGNWEAAARIWEELGEFAEAVRAWQRAGKPDESRRCGTRRDMIEGRFARAAETLEEIGDFSAAAGAWAKAATARQQPITPRPLPLPAAAWHSWCQGSKPARLARPASPRRSGGPRGGNGPRAPRGTPAGLHGARLRGLVCAVRDLEDGGQFDAAARTWRMLRDPEQSLRCQVTHLDRSGHSGEAAALLESKKRHAAAAEHWRRAGDTRAAARCEALDHEKTGRFEEALALWASLGESQHSARCRAILRFRQGDLANAARDYELAGQTDMAVAVRQVLAERGDLFGHTPRPSPAMHVPPADPRGAISMDAGAPVNAMDAVLGVVRQHPGLTCEEVAGLTRTTTRQVKPILGALVARGILARTGRTRGTRYHLVG